MPIYEYQCTACGHKLEKLQKISDAQLKDCPSCHEPRLAKLVSAAGFRLKGAGWYETDFKSGNKKNVLQGADTGSESGSATSAASESPASENKSDKAGSDGKSGDSSTKSKPDVAAAS